MTIAIFSIATLLARNTTISLNQGTVMRQIRQVLSPKNMTYTHSARVLPCVQLTENMFAANCLPQTPKLNAPFAAPKMT